MKIEPFTGVDVVPFLELAAKESWVSETWEFDFLLAEFSQGCFAARDDNGEPVGFVTSLRHDRSGWIGNLIVSCHFRGRGIGEALFRRAMGSLLDNRVETIWLTASKAGMPLYQKFGFKRIDTIIRWSGSRRECRDISEGNACGNINVPFVNAIDSNAWGDCRAALLSVTVERGKLLQHESGFVVVQPCGHASQLGPFSAPDYNTADHLLKAAVNSTSPGSMIYLDAPASNRLALRLFNTRGMRISGSNQLMYSGTGPAYRPELIFGLATMGSCG